jgi:thiopurine S-methyltransferase
MRAHIDLYVNEFSANIGEEGKASIQYLFEHHPVTEGGQYTTPLFITQNGEDSKIEMLSREYWSSRYQNDMTGWDIGQISPPIKAYIDQLENKSMRILIPGAGNGYEAEYLHNQGFGNVFVCDIAPEALNNLAERCPSFPRQNFLLEDFFDLNDTFDLIIEQTFFCALNPSLRIQYIRKMSQLLNKNGKLAGLLFAIDFPFAGPPFGGNIKEYESIISSQLRLVTLEPCYNSILPRSGNELFFIALK